MSSKKTNYIKPWVKSILKKNYYLFSNFNYVKLKINQEFSICSVTY